ncbi:Uu.00g114780.m01.CDS01 [Anthostomella pinea]|uniref:Uu.00g114780.m01.CDS01 n=1 Tax=Anthostomella pinea TaxID=933095 RepID=A0AAI8VFN9_9PEZI|nr:Uu.00g114780.m01.CDS01 [Anthostomella pinea]
MKTLLAWAHPIDSCTTGGQKGWHRRIRRFIAIAVVACLSVTALLALTSSYHHYDAFGHSYNTRNTQGPADRRKPPASDGPGRPEYFQWETSSSFSPVAQDIKGASLEQLCRSFPKHILQNSVQPILRMSHGQDSNKIRAQFESVSACIDNLLIFSDSGELIHGREVVDILKDLPAAYRFKNADFKNYTILRNLHPKPQIRANATDESRTIDGRTLDAYKFLPMIERAWETRPSQKWYFFYETDTYVVWDNLFRFLENLDHETPLYIGSAAPERLKYPGKPESATWFADGGPGFVLSRAAMLKLLHRKVGKDGDYLEPPLSRRWLDLMRRDRRGDRILGWALHDVGIRLSGFWPMFNPHSLQSIPFSQAYWCQPVLTLHKTKPEEMVKLWRWEHSRRKVGRPLIYRDLYDFRHNDRQVYREDWDNTGWDGYRGPRVNSFAACGKACGEDPECFQYNWHMGDCMFMSSIRYGEHRGPKLSANALMRLQGEIGKEWTYELSRYMSGWMLPSIDKWYQEQQCEAVQWLPLNAGDEPHHRQRHSLLPPAELYPAEQTQAILYIAAANGNKAFLYCEGSPSWNPDAYAADTALQARAEEQLSKDDLQSAIATSFALRRNDSYVYHAIVSVTLPQVQHVVSLGGANGLHAWYRTAAAPPPSAPKNDDDDGGNGNSTATANANSESYDATTSSTDPRPNPNSTSKPPQPQQRQQPPPALPPPPQADIETYLSIFSPLTSTPSALKTFSSNAKKGSLRSEIAHYLLSKRYIHPSLPALATLSKSKCKTAPPNPYLTFLSWACRNLEWAGPSPSSAGRSGGHHVLPILMHHFGCVCPSHEALQILVSLADGREVIDMGSGNGYWTWALRQQILHQNQTQPQKQGKKSTPPTPTPTSTITPVDNAQSSWRITWVPDTYTADGPSYLRTTRHGAPDAVLLLVYPIVGGGVAGGREGGFTCDMIAAYTGNTLAVVGTQNRNGYTGFRDVSMDEYMEREHGDEWTKVVQVPLPSFPGKDEALFVFQRGERAPARIKGEEVEKKGNTEDDKPGEKE